MNEIFQKQVAKANSVNAPRLESLHGSTQDLLVKLSRICRSNPVFHFVYALDRKEKKNFPMRRFDPMMSAENAENSGVHP
jgi:hypothetical protein